MGNATRGAPGAERDPAQDRSSPQVGHAARHSTRASRIAGLTGVLLLAFLSTAAAQYAVRNGTVAGGGGTLSSGQYRLIGTVGEPAAGTVSTPQYRLTSGFPATIGDARDGGIFSDSFEGPSGNYQ